ncbi:MAG TPA: serine hydrolase domain-containing protein [Xanthomonadaceae bacterium]|nr:serine hydrolase domain-containing protein [Xanthomonadaceae bacterium]
MLRILLALCLFASPYLPGTEALAQTEPPERVPAEAVEAGMGPTGQDVDADLGEAFDIDVLRGDLVPFVDGVALSLLHEHELAALTVSVVRNDALVLARGYGLADVANRQPVVAEETLFRIGSVSKTFIWTAAMMLAERGKLDLDADVNMYLRQVRVDDAFGAPVTMRHLMHHRAGFEDSMRLFAVADNDGRTLAELLAEHQPKRVFRPGARTSYSNWGSALAAQIVEDVANLPYAEFLQQEILFPLGMRDTTLAAPGAMNERQRARLAGGYKQGKGALATQNYMQIGPYWPAGGIASTATDMARWMRFHLNRGELDGTRLLRADTHAQMWTRAFDDRPAANDVAHGFQDRHYRGLRSFGHGGGTAAFLTNMVMVPELGLGVFLSQNSTHSRSPISQLPDRIIDRMAGLDLRADVEVEAGEAGALSEVAGTYLHNRRVFSSFAAVLGLAATATVQPLSGDALRISSGSEARQFRRVEGQRDVFEAVDGSRIAFLRDGGGRVTAAADSMGVHTLEKVGAIGAPSTLFIAMGAAALLALTTLLGFWWRMGRYRDGGFASTIAAAIGLLAALAMIALLVTVGLMVTAFASFDLSTMPGNYPSPEMLNVHYAGWLLAGAAIAMLFALWPAWSGSRWGLWRRLHFSVFALTLAFLAFLLWQWRMIGAPLY